MRRTVRTAAGLVTALLALQGLPSDALTKEATERVAPSIVQLGPLYTGKDKDGKAFQGSFPWGNGTFVSAGGYILTSATTANVSVLIDDARKNGAEIIDGVVVVSIAKDTSQIPVPAFIAKVVAIDAISDLALVQVTTDLSGRPITAGSVTFPALPFGNADSMKVGDAITAIGYQVRNDSVYFSARSIKGFRADRSFDGRSAIALSSSISSGFVGTGAVDDAGRLVGVAAFGADPSPPTVPAGPCTPTIDTNRDGRIDANDTCAPPDPGIAALRSVNAVMAFFATLNKAQATRTTPTTLPPTVPSVPVVSVPQTPQPQTPLPVPAPSTVPPRSEVPADPTRPLPTSPAPASNDVYLRGTVYDSVTGRPVTKGYVFLLKPGSAFGKSKQSDVLAAFAIGQDGRWGIASYRWKRGENYPIAVNADGYEIAFSNSFRIDADAPDPLVVDIQVDPT